MRHLSLLVLVFLLVIALGVPAAAGQPATSDWKVYTYAPSGNTLTSRHADADGADPAFAFGASPDTALFATQRPLGSQSSLAGKTITATFRIDAPATASFQYSGEGTPSNPCGTPATVRLYFSSNGPFGSNKDWYSNFWWSRSSGSSQVLAAGTYTITATVAIGSWSNWNGKLDSDRPD